MHGKHAFVDESRRAGYVICAVMLAAGDLTAARQAMTALRQPRQRAIHMATEGTRRRREIISRVLELPFEAYIYQSAITRRSERQTRNDCLRAAMPDLLAAGMSRLVIESCDQDRDDRLVLYETVRKANATDRLSYHHERPASEPLLWLPDIVAWAYGKGGDWRRRLKQASTRVHRVEP